MYRRKGFFTLSFSILGAAIIIGTIILPLTIQLFFSLGPIGFIIFLLIFFFVGSCIFER